MGPGTRGSKGVRTIYLGGERPRRYYVRIDGYISPFPFLDEDSHMPRPLRPIAEGLVYHVINRGNNRQPIFGGDGDYLAFLKAIADLKQRTSRGRLDQPRRAKPAGVAHAALPPLPSQQRACLAGSIQEPGHSRRRSSAVGLAVYRGQPLAREEGEASGGLSLEQF